ncbi:MAG: hypothetical protein Q8K62_00385 [Thiobacillus sp.]|nr:hypothetical protein [Pseudomonadota bacterium]MDP1926947.1 hypothetical protein [Thiobacillus sp.]
MDDIAYLLRWNNEAEDSLKPLLVEFGIPFVERKLFLKGGIFAAGGATVVEILQAVSALGLAGVLIAWINAKANRKIHIVKNDRSIEFLAQGYSKEEVAKILSDSHEINVIELPENKT